MCDIGRVNVCFKLLSFLHLYLLLYYNFLVWCIFSLLIRRTAIYLGASGKNLTLPFTLTTSISYKTDVFPLPIDVYRIYSMFLCYNVAWPCDLWPWECFINGASHARPTYQFWLSYDYLLLSYDYRIWSHFRYLQQSLCMRRVTWPLTGGWRGRGQK